MKYRMTHGFSSPTRVLENAGETRFIATERSSDAAYWVDFRMEAPIDDSFIMIPACAYDGNRFEAVSRRYPPMFLEEEMCVHPPVRMTQVPRLAQTGDSFMDVTTGDMTAPCVCLLRKSLKQALLVFFEQETHGLNHGVTLEQQGDELLVRLRAPAKRRLVYRWYDGVPSLREMPEADLPLSVEAGEETALVHRVFALPCEDIVDLYRLFFEKRQELFHGAPHANLPFSHYWELAEKRMESHYIESEKYLAISADDNRGSRFGHWQAGWVGGGISTLPLIVEGSALSRKRAVETLEFAARTQSAAGWYYGIWANGCVYYDDFEYYGERYSATMVRKHADLVYYMYRQIAQLEAMKEEVPESVRRSARMGADALVTLWERYGQYGQFVNAETGEILVGGSTAGAMAPAALCQAYLNTGDERYAQTAKASGEALYHTATELGVTTGGPGEILQAPDSESSAAVLESFMALYELTRESKWLERSKEAAYQLSTWVVAYDYRFPADSKLGKFGVCATGSVWASVQNKHSAPGLCTVSPLALFKLFRYTGDVNFLMLMRDVARFIPQVASYPERPMPTDKGRFLSPSEICERVNLSDWEGRIGVGDHIFGASAWPEVSMMLTWLDIPGIYADPNEGIVCVSDHVTAWLEGSELVIENPTQFDAQVKVFTPARGFRVSVKSQTIVRAAL